MTVCLFTYRWQHCCSGTQSCVLFSSLGIMVYCPYGVFNSSVLSVPDRSDAVCIITYKSSTSVFYYYHYTACDEWMKLGFDDNKGKVNDRCSEVIYMLSKVMRQGVDQRRRLRGFMLLMFKSDHLCRMFCDELICVQQTLIQVETFPTSEQK